MKAGDLVKIPAKQGYGIVVRIINSPMLRNHSAIVMCDDGKEEYCNIRECKVVNESR